MSARLHILLDDDYRIIEVGLGFELLYHEPARLRWFCLFEAPTVVHCEKAYVSIMDGETPPNWEEMDP